MRLILNCKNFKLVLNLKDFLYLRIELYLNEMCWKSLGRYLEVFWIYNFYCFCKVFKVYKVLLEEFKDLIRR